MLAQYNPRIQKMKTGSLGVQGHLELHNHFQAGLGCINPISKKKKNPLRLERWLTDGE